MLLMLVKEFLDYFENSKNLVEYLTGARVVEQLELHSRLDTETAARLLREACDLEDDARRLKLTLALAHLESAHTILARHAMIPWWRSIGAAYHRADTFESASHVAFHSAVTYCALGVDPASARERLADAERWHLRRMEIIKKNLERDLRLVSSSRSAGGFGNPLPPKTVAHNIAVRKSRLHSLDAEVGKTKAMIAEAMTTLNLSPLCNYNPWNDTL